MPERVLFEDLVHRPAGLNRENHVEPIADLRVLLNADYEIFAEQIPGQLHHEREMLAEVPGAPFLPKSPPAQAKE